MVHYLGVQSGSIALFRGLPRFFKTKVLDQAGAEVTLASGDGAHLVICTSLSPDSNSVIHTFTDLYVDTDNTLRKDFSAADIALLPLGTFFAEVTYIPAGDSPYPVVQANVSVYPTQHG